MEKDLSSSQQNTNNQESVKSQHEKFRPKEKEPKPSKNLWSIHEAGDGFEAILPGLLWPERESILPTSEKFETREQAQKAIDRARQEMPQKFERMSLEKTFTPNFWHIDETKNGKFLVTTPEFKNSEIGTTQKEFDTWQEAKDFYLEARESNELIAHNPILRLEKGLNGEMAFSSLEAFDPDVAPTENQYSIPVFVKSYMDKEDLRKGGNTYLRTLEQEGWEKNLFVFIERYAQEEGSKLVKELGIDKLNNLTPKQAAELSTRMVIALTKYDKQEDADHIGNPGDLLRQPKLSRADKLTAQQILEEGLRKRRDDDWKGNGVCRNFASSVKAVFESLKSNQTKFNRLRNTYCVYEAGDEYMPKKPSSKSSIISMGGKIGHAWNSFITISKKGEANTVITDATWGSRDLDTKSFQNMDYTLTRMESFVYQAGMSFDEDGPKKQEQIAKLLDYYSLAIEESPTVSSDPIPVNSLSDKEKEYYLKKGTDFFISYGHDPKSYDENTLLEIGIDFVKELNKLRAKRSKDEFFASRAIEIMGKAGIPDNVPETIVDMIAEKYKTAANISYREIQSVYAISQKNSRVNFLPILKNYIEQMKDQPPFRQGRDIFFTDDNLQRMVFDEVKSENFFEDRLQKGDFRARVRKVWPKFFIDFSPSTNSADFAELNHLVEKNRLIKSRLKSTSEVEDFFADVRNKLKETNEEKYAEITEGLDDYQVIEQYDKLYRQLEEAKTTESKAENNKKVDSSETKTESNLEDLTESLVGSIDDTSENAKANKESEIVADKETEREELEKPEDLLELRHALYEALNKNEQGDSFNVNYSFSESGFELNITKMNKDGKEEPVYNIDDWSDKSRLAYEKLKTGLVAELSTKRDNLVAQYGEKVKTVEQAVVEAEQNAVKKASQSAQPNLWSRIKGLFRR